MVARLGLAPAVAFAVLSTAGVASAQYYPAETQGESAYDSAVGSRAIEDVEVPAAYDPYNSPGTNAAAQGSAPATTYGAPPPGVRDAYTQPLPGMAAQQPPGSVPSGSYGNAPAANVPPGVPPIANAPYASPDSQPVGYPPGAYSGQQPAGMPSPYANVPAQAVPAQSVPAQGAANRNAYGQPQNLGGDYGANGSSVAILPAEDQPEEGPPKELPAHLKRQVVDYATKQPPGTIIIDTPNTYLYYVLPDGKAERFGIGVGRDGFTWAGTEKISRKAEWPDWRPPAEMIERQPYLPRFMAGGPGNPMGARALYLGHTIYRIHGTNQPSTIGQFMSSGCIRMLNEDVESLYERVKVGTKVVVLPGSQPVAGSPNTTAAMPATDGAVSVR